MSSFPYHSETERRALQGEPYRCVDDDFLSVLYLRARDLCFRLNTLHPVEREEQRRLLEELLGTLGEGTEIATPLFFDFGKHTRIGRNCWINTGVVVLDGGPVVIGDNVYIGPSVGLYTALHPLVAEERNQGIEFTRPITICDNVWIGGNATILPGVTIGEGAVVGAGSVVKHDIPPRVLAVGNPAKVNREIS